MENNPGHSLSIQVPKNERILKIQLESHNPTDGSVQYVPTNSNEFENYAGCGDCPNKEFSCFPTDSRPLLLRVTERLLTSADFYTPSERSFIFGPSFINNAKCLTPGYKQLLSLIAEERIRSES